MADMLVKLYNMPYSHDIEENLFKSGISIKKALGTDQQKGTYVREKSEL